MAKSGLTDLKIRSLPVPTHGQSEVWDSKVPGFGLRISSAGTKSFVLVYRFRGRPRRLTLGRYPTISLAKARNLAHQALADINSGCDPITERQTAAQTTYDIPNAFEMFLELHCRRHNRPSTIIEAERILRTVFLPPWKARPLIEIAKRDVVAVLDAVVARGSPGSANRAMAVIRKFFNWCVERGMLETTPCLGLRNPAKPGRRDRVLSNSELAVVWRAAQQVDCPFAPIVHLLILTGQRRGEIAGLQWQDIDFDAGLLKLSAERTKANRAHVVPLSPRTIRIIECLPAVHAKWLFPARGGVDQAYNGFNKAKAHIDRLCGFDDWTLHDLRRTAATGMARLGVAPHVVERVLNHTSGTFAGVVGVYNRFDYLKEMRVALDVWSEHVESLLTSEHEPADVGIERLRIQH